MTDLTDQELIAKAKRMCLTMKGFRMGMPETKGGQTVTIGVDSLERITALAILGMQFMALHRKALEDVGPTGVVTVQLLDTMLAEWTSGTNLLVGQVTDPKTGEKS